MKIGHNYMKSGGAVFAAICAAALALPLFADPVQIDPNDYECSFNVKFAGYKGASTLADFPVLMRLSKALNDFNYAKCADGANLRFADSNGNLLSHEIDTWDASGESLVWVKIPSLTKETVIKVLYGYKGSGEQPAVTAADVWSNGYVGVWHLNESALPMKDSSGVSKNFTSAGYDATNIADLGLASDGVVGKSVNFRGDEGKKCSLSADDDDNLDGFTEVTFEFWTNQSIHDSSDRFIMTKRQAWNHDNAYTFYDQGAKHKTSVAYASVMGDGTNTNVSVSFPDSCIPEVNRWNYQSCVYSVASAFSSNYLNGAAINGNNLSSFANLGAIRNSAGKLRLGNAGTDSSYAFPGRIDEVRISNVARSKDWIEAAYDTVMDGGFATCISPDGNDWSKYSHRFTVSFEGYAGETTLADFPVLVRIAEYDEGTGSGIQGFSYADCLKPNGGDLRFADATGALLDSEVDTWNPAGESFVWVKVPSLNASTMITAYYGWNMASSVTPSAVWTNGFVGVWHLDEDGLVQKDSTANGIDFVSPGNPYYVTNYTFQVSGSVGSAVDFSKGKNGCFIAADDGSGLLDGYEGMTVEVWTWQDHHDPEANPAAGYFLSKYRNVSGATDNGWNYIMCESANNGKMSFALKHVDGETMKEDWITVDDSYQKPARAAWNHNVGVFDGPGKKGFQYLNGAVSAEKALTYGGIVRSTVGNLHLGNQFQSWSSSFPGKLDEVRLSSVARSADWIKATHDTIAVPNFATYGEATRIVRGLSVILR